METEKYSSLSVRQDPSFNSKAIAFKCGLEGMEHRTDIFQQGKEKN